MKVLGIILNLFLPGVGSFVVGKFGQGTGQLLLWGFGLLLTIITLGFGGLIGFPMMLGAWIWGLVTVIGNNVQPVQFIITDSRSNHGGH